MKKLACGPCIKGVEPITNTLWSSKCHKHTSRLELCMSDKDISCCPCRCRISRFLFLVDSFRIKQYLSIADLTFAASRGLDQGPQIDEVIEHFCPRTGEHEVEELTRRILVLDQLFRRTKETASSCITDNASLSISNISASRQMSLAKSNNNNNSSSSSRRLQW